MTRLALNPKANLVPNPRKVNVNLPSSNAWLTPRPPGIKQSSSGTAAKSV